MASVRQNEVDDILRRDSSWQLVFASLRLQRPWLEQALFRVDGPVFWPVLRHTPRYISSHARLAHFKDHMRYDFHCGRFTLTCLPTAGRYHERNPKHTTLYRWDYSPMDTTPEQGAPLGKSSFYTTPKGKAVRVKSRKPIDDIK